MKPNPPPLLVLGQTYPPYGQLSAIAWLGERYYFFVDGNSVAMLPASLFSHENQKEKVTRPKVR